MTQPPREPTPGGYPSGMAMPATSPPSQVGAMLRGLVHGMDRSIVALLGGTFVLRVSTAITGTMLVFYLRLLDDRGLAHVGGAEIALLAGGFYIVELIGSPIFGAIADRVGRKPILLLGPLFGAVAVTVTGLTALVPVLFVTRLLEGGSAAASIPAILALIAANTENDEVMRGRVVALFELATLGGLVVVGPPVAGILFQVLHEHGFFVNTALYLVAFGLYYYGVSELREGGGAAVSGRAHLARLVHLATNRRILLFAPTWIAVNAIFGVWFPQLLFQLTGRGSAHAANQLLMRGFEPLHIGLAAGFGGVLFAIGLLYWGNAFGRYRRSSIMLAGLVAFAVVTGVLFLVNHAFGAPPIALVGLGLIALAGLFVLAGATPAALGYLADVSEGFPEDRSAIMGLYSVFLAVGQIGGTTLAGFAADRAGVDGIVAATAVLIVVAFVALLALRSYEHRLATPLERPVGSAAPPH
jgi:MFS family permease